MSASAYLLITNLFLVADGSQAGYGGADTHMQQFANEIQCNIAKNAFLNDMQVTHKELTGDKSKYISTKVTRKAKCVNLNPVTDRQASTAITVTINPDGSHSAMRDGKPLMFPKVKEVGDVLIGNVIISQEEYEKLKAASRDGYIPTRN